MNVYKNKITGVEVSTHGKVNGANWLFVREEITGEEAAAAKNKTKAKAKAANDGKDKEPDGE